HLARRKSLTFAAVPAGSQFGEGSRKYDVIALRDPHSLDARGDVLLAARYQYSVQFLHHEPIARTPGPVHGGFRARPAALARGALRGPWQICATGNSIRAMRVGSSCHGVNSDILSAHRGKRSARRYAFWRRRGSSNRTIEGSPSST